MESISLRALYEIAEDQMGFVTSAQAVDAGVRPMALVMLERRGRIDRVSHGVYRLKEFPVSPLAQYMQAILWPRGPRGVLSHETALALYELSDIDPPKVHITLPPHFRVQREVPSYLVVHRAALSESDVTRFEGMPITTPARSIRDCIAAHVGPAIISDAIEQASRSGMISPAEAERLQTELRTPAEYV